MIEVWTDGSCLRNPDGPGGWAALIVVGGEVESQHTGSAPTTTNNRMELTAALEGLRALPDGSRGTTVTVVTDSTYVSKGSMLWLPKWKQNGWRKADRHRRGKGVMRGAEISNRDLWELMDRELSKRVVRMRRVKGHSGVALNEKCDELAHIEAVWASKALRRARSSPGPDVRVQSVEDRQRLGIQAQTSFEDEWAS